MEAHIRCLYVAESLPGNLPGCQTILHLLL